MDVGFIATLRLSLSHPLSPFPSAETGRTDASFQGASHMTDWLSRRTTITTVIVVCALAITTCIGALFASRLLIGDLARLATVGERDRVASGAAIAQAGNVLSIITISTIVLLVLTCLLLIFALQASHKRHVAADALAEGDRVAGRIALAEMVLAGKVKDDFLASVSHELRNPLAAILTWTQLLRSKTLDEAKSRRALEIIERNVVSQTLLIDDLIDVSRAVAGKFRFEVRPIELAPVIRAAVEAQAPASNARDVGVRLELNDGVGLVSGDAERLQQVMSNMISNAIKFTRKGGLVSLALRKVQSHAEITVHDDGIGIEAGFLPHVFEPFRQATGGPTRSSSGLGLGLSIARHIVELHGGVITAESAGPGCGSTFTIQLPLLGVVPGIGPRLPGRTLTRHAVSEIQPRRLDGVRVLVVEDEPATNESLVVLFEACGAEASGVASAIEALAAFDVQPPDVVVSDIGMPGEDGCSLIRRIRLRTRAGGGEVPAVALTAYTKVEDRLGILGAGFQVYLSKRADPNELVAVVDHLARREPLPEVVS